MLCAPPPFCAQGSRGNRNIVSGSSASLFKPPGKQWSQRFTQEVGREVEVLLWLPPTPTPNPCLTPCPSAHLGFRSSLRAGNCRHGSRLQGAKSWGPLWQPQLYLCQLWRSRLLRVPSRNSDRWTSVNRGVVPNAFYWSGASSGSGAPMPGCSALAHLLEKAFSMTLPPCPLVLSLKEQRC